MEMAQRYQLVWCRVLLVEYKLSGVKEDPQSHLQLRWGSDIDLSLHVALWIWSVEYWLSRLKEGPQGRWQLRHRVDVAIWGGDIYLSLHVVLLILSVEYQLSRVKEDPQGHWTLELHIDSYDMELAYRYGFGWCRVFVAWVSVIACEWRFSRSLHSSATLTITTWDGVTIYIDYNDLVFVGGVSVIALHWPVVTRWQLRHGGGVSIWSAYIDLSLHVVLLVLLVSCLRWAKRFLLLVVINRYEKNFKWILYFIC